MVRKFKSIALAGAFVMVAAPAFAQMPPAMNPLGIDVDPFHIFTPAPAPEPAPMMMKPHHHHMMMHHKKMMMMHKKKMMMHKKMMKKM